MPNTQSPKNVIAFRNLLTASPKLESLIEKADLRGASLPDKGKDINGRDYYFPASLKGQIEALQKEMEEALRPFYEQAQAIAIENIENANAKLKEAFQLENGFTAPAFRPVDLPSLFSHVKAGIHDGAVNNWYTANPDVPRIVESTNDKETESALGFSF